MKTKDGIPMPGAKRANQNQPNGGKEKKPLVLPKLDEASVIGKTGHEGHTRTVKAKGSKK
jgi:hypothetical protein